MDEKKTLPSQYSNDPTCSRFNGLREGTGAANKNLRHVNGELSTLEDALHNDSDSVRSVTQEKAIHRRFCDLTLQGYTPTEIASITGYSMQWVSQVLKQPYARDYFIKQSKKTVMQEMKDFLEAEVLPSLKTLKSVRDDVFSRNVDKISASNALLDRFLGKPTQVVQHEEKSPDAMTDEELRKAVENELRAGTN